MLVLTRKRMEQIRIGPDIFITVVKLDRNQVRLGIEAPSDVTVLRAELVRPDRISEGQRTGLLPVAPELDATE